MENTQQPTATTQNLQIPETKLQQQELDGPLKMDNRETRGPSIEPTEEQKVLDKEIPVIEPNEQEPLPETTLTPPPTKVQPNLVPEAEQIQSEPNANSKEEEAPKFEESKEETVKLAEQEVKPSEDQTHPEEIVKVEEKTPEEPPAEEEGKTQLMPESGIIAEEAKEVSSIEEGIGKIEGMKKKSGEMDCEEQDKEREEKEKIDPTKVNLKRSSPSKAVDPEIEKEEIVKPLKKGKANEEVGEGEKKVADD